MRSILNAQFALHIGRPQGDPGNVASTQQGLELAVVQPLHMGTKNKLWDIASKTRIE
jgi:hypothetical protein